MTMTREQAESIVTRAQGWGMKPVIHELASDGEYAVAFPILANIDNLWYVFDRSPDEVVLYEVLDWIGRIPELTYGRMD